MHPIAARIYCSMGVYYESEYKGLFYTDSYAQKEQKYTMMLMYLEAVSILKLNCLGKINISKKNNNNRKLTKIIFFAYIYLLFPSFIY